MTFRCVAFLFALIVTTARADIKQVLPVDIKAGMIAGTMHMTSVPVFTGDSTKAFDGSPYSEMAMLQSDSLVVTLQFDSPIEVQKCKVFLWNYGTWMVEGASSLADLNSRTGTYALLADTNAYSFFLWDSVSFTPRMVSVLRMRARNSQGVGVYLGEWVIENTVTFNRLAILPAPVRVIPGGRLQLRLKVVDDQGRIYDNFLNEPLNWLTADPAIATADADGKLTGKTVGTTTITVSTDQNTISGSAVVEVMADFHPEKVATMNVKVALVLQDPLLPNDHRLHQEFGWRDPMLLSNDLVRHFREATDSVVNFQFVEVVYADTLFTRYKGNFLSISQFVQLLKEPNWTSLKAASDSGQIGFDYRAMVKYYQYDTKRNNGEIDEVWVFSAPYLGMYESQLLGPNAFWWNSPPIRDGTSLTKLLSVMGLNYERGVDQAFHSFGHRMESAMVQAYHDAQGRSWDPTSSNPTPWDLFTRINKDVPGQSHVGNIHFPPNGTHDYEYGNATFVTSYAENWYRYPYLFDMHSQVNVSTWYFSPGDPLAEGLDHLGYLRWWYNHLPRYTGSTDGVLNNWWHYSLDYETAVILAGNTPELAVPEGTGSRLPPSFHLDQNYPNPFNPSTVIGFTLRENARVSLAVYDLLGRKIDTIIDGVLTVGPHSALWDARRFASGVYFCRLVAGAQVETKRMMLIK